METSKNGEFQKKKRRKNMKIKTSILVLLMVLSCFVLASCGKKTEEPETEKTEEKTKEKTKEKTEAKEYRLHER